MPGTERIGAVENKVSKLETAVKTTATSEKVASVELRLERLEKQQVNRLTACAVIGLTAAAGVWVGMRCGHSA